MEDENKLTKDLKVIYDRVNSAMPSRENATERKKYWNNLDPRDKTAFSMYVAITEDKTEYKNYMETGAPLVKVDSNGDGVVDFNDVSGWW